MAATPVVATQKNATIFTKSASVQTWENATWEDASIFTQSVSVQTWTWNNASNFTKNVSVQACDLEKHKYFY